MSLSKTKRQVVTLYGSSLLGILTGVFVSILNTSNLPPVEYGDVRYINNFISFFSGILLFGYFVSGSRLLALSKSKEETRRMKGILTTILLTTFATMMVIMVVCGVIHGSILHKEYSYLFYTAIPVCGSVLFLNYINTTSQGDNNINAIAAARLFPSLIYLVVAYLIYRYYGASRERMILLHNGIAMIFLLFLILKARPDFSHLRESWKILNEENKKYGLQVYYGSLANVSVQYVAGITLGLFGTNNANVGYYTLALTVSMPLTMLPQVVGTTYFKRFASEDRISPKVIKYTVLITLLSYILFVLAIHPIIRLLYKPEYISVAYFATLLGIGCVLNGLGDVFNRFLGAHGKGVYLRNGAFISGGVALVGYTLMVYLFDIHGAIATRIISTLVYCLMMVYYYKKMTNVQLI